MSGGYIRPQKEGDHQIVHFTFVGKITPDQVSKWNDSVLKLKQMFGVSLTGITLKGESTPPDLLRKQKKKKK
jgi:hypothetical protein